MKRRTFCFILVACAIMIVLPVSAFAAGMDGSTESTAAASASAAPTVGVISIQQAKTPSTEDHTAAPQLLAMMLAGGVLCAAVCIAEHRKNSER